MIEQNVAGGAKAVPAAKAAGAGAKAVPAAKTAGTGAKMISTTKAVLLSPMFGIAVLAGIIGWELWKGSKDAKELESKG